MPADQRETPSTVATSAFLKGLGYNFVNWSKQRLYPCERMHTARRWWWRWRGETGWGWKSHSCGLQKPDTRLCLAYTEMKRCWNRLKLFSRTIFSASLWIRLHLAVGVCTSPPGIVPTPERIQADLPLSSDHTVDFRLGRGEMSFVRRDIQRDLTCREEKNWGTRTARAVQYWQKSRHDFWICCDKYCNIPKTNKKKG